METKEFRKPKETLKINLKYLQKCGKIERARDIWACSELFHFS